MRCFRAQVPMHIEQQILEEVGKDYPTINQDRIRMVLIEPQRKITTYGTSWRHVHPEGQVYDVYLTLLDNGDFRVELQFVRKIFVR